MIVTGFMAFAAAAAMQAQPASVRESAGAMSVGATVIRPEPQPVIAVQRGAAIVSNAASVIVSAEGGTLSRAADGTILVTAGGPRTMRITLTY
jgi:hypothetical protein